MRRIIHIILITVFVASLPRFSIGQSTGFYDKTMLWEINGPGLPGKSYLLGTIHVMCLHGFTANEQILNVLKSCNEAVFEINTIRSDTSLYDRYVIDQYSIEKLIGKKYFKKLSDLVNTTKKYSIDSLNHIQPFVVASLLPKILMDCKTTSVDQIVLQLARRENLHVSNLETFSQNSSHLKNMPLSRQAEILKDRLAHLIDLRTATLTDISLYMSGSLWELYQRQFPDESEPDEIRTALLDSRSQQWVTKIRQKIMEHSTVFVFGCSHLPGKNGILNSLAKLGYSVNPVISR